MDSRRRQEAPRLLILYKSGKQKSLVSYKVDNNDMGASSQSETEIEGCVSNLQDDDIMLAVEAFRRTRTPSPRLVQCRPSRRRRRDPKLLLLRVHHCHSLGRRAAPYVVLPMVSPSSLPVLAPATARCRASSLVVPLPVSLAPQPSSSSPFLLLVPCLGAPPIVTTPPCDPDAHCCPDIPKAFSLLWFHFCCSLFWFLIFFNKDGNFMVKMRTLWFNFAHGEALQVATRRRVCFGGRGSFEHRRVGDVVPHYWSQLLQSLFGGWLCRKKFDEGKMWFLGVFDFPWLKDGVRCKSEEYFLDFEDNFSSLLEEEEASWKGNSSVDLLKAYGLFESPEEKLEHIAWQPFESDMVEHEAEVVDCIWISLTVRLR
ncbi:hypothetical protein V8G54_014668 [Vigna mungo]|uniref:Uncharacterized protein n=1 Tax=Vigna mungo TaxID=3915 RepID=A0AAQ3NJS9_VIGMU